MSRKLSHHGTPRWVKVFGLIALVLILLTGVMLLAGHGPGQHAPSGGAGARTPSAAAVMEFGSRGGHAPR
jgi:hypothetical protein